MAAKAEQTRASHELVMTCRCSSAAAAAALAVAAEDDMLHPRGPATAPQVRWPLHATPRAHLRCVCGQHSHHSSQVRAAAS